MPMKSKQLVFAAIIGVVACFLTWLLMTDTSSPLQEYLMHNPALRNFWGDMIFPVFAISMILGLPPWDIIGYPLVFLQWFLLALFVGWVCEIVRRKLDT